MEQQYFLGALADGGATPEQIADAAVAVWQVVQATLSPVIGMGGVSALYRRTLHLHREDRPWMAAAIYGSVKPGDYTSLHACFLNQDAVIAAGAHDAMVRSLFDLLREFIGPSLTQRLMQPATPFPNAGNAVQDPSP